MAQARETNAHALSADLVIKEFFVKKDPSLGFHQKPDEGFADGDLRYESQNRLLMRGEQIRYEYNHPMYRIAKGYSCKKGMIVTCDGTVVKELFPNGSGNTDKPWGFIQDKANGPMPSYSLTPLMVYFRGTDPNWCRYDLKRLQATGRTIPIGDVKCQEYVIEGTNNYSERFAIDSQKNDLIRQITSIKGGKKLNQFDIEYREDPDAGWVPSSWTILEFGYKEALQNSWQVSVQNLQLNPNLPDSLFDLQFPEGCRVTDCRTGEYFEILADGDRKKINARDEMVPLPVPLPWYGRRMSIFLFCATPVFLAVLLLCRKRRPLNGPVIAPG